MSKPKYTAVSGVRCAHNRSNSQVSTDQETLVHGILRHARPFSRQGRSEVPKCHACWSRSGAHQLPSVTRPSLSPHCVGRSVSVSSGPRGPTLRPGFASQCPLTPILCGVWIRPSGVRSKRTRISREIKREREREV